MQPLIRYSLFSFLFLTCFVTQAQEDYLWWNDVHHWDGHTSWNQYMTYSTSFFGPNALPVPDVMNGGIDSLKTIEIDGGYNWSKGDKTKDTYIKGYLPLFKNRIAFVLDAVPIEWYKMDTITRDVRAARNRSGEGKAGGDIYFQTLIAILKERQKLPDVSLRIALRTASGTNLRNARYTDGPGYFFDLSAGKSFKSNSFVMRPYIMTGFYVYQTNDLEHLQNDCVLFGAGVDFAYKKIILRQSIGGYRGYLSDGDDPLVYRATLEWKRKNVNWTVGYQNGLQDYPYQRIRVGVIYKLSWLKFHE